MKQVNVLAEDAWYTLAAGRKVSEVRAWLRDCRILFYPFCIRRSFGFCNCGFAAPLDSAFLYNEDAYSEITCLAKARFFYQIHFSFENGNHCPFTNSLNSYCLICKAWASAAFLAESASSAGARRAGGRGKAREGREEE